MVRFLLFAVVALPLAGCGSSRLDPLTPPEGYFTGADNTRIYYRTEGTGSDTVVILHGIGSGASYLAPDIAPLADNRRMLYYDQRGFVRSDLVKDGDSLRLDRHVADLANGDRWTARSLRSL